MASLLVQPLATDASMKVIEGLSERISNMDLSCLLVYDIDNVNASALTHLADQFSLLDEPAWEFAISDDDKRALLKQAIELHRHKGTPWAVEQLCALLGFGVVELIEGTADWMYDGSVAYDDTHTYGDETGWAEYYIIVPRTVSVSEGEKLNLALLKVARRSCKLALIDFTEHCFSYDGSVDFDGSYTFGAIGF